MRVAEVLSEISRRGITLRCGRTEDRLNAKPTSALTPELVEEIREHKMEIIQIMREDEDMRRTGIIQSERQVFDLAREHFDLQAPDSCRRDCDGRRADHLRVGGGGHHRGLVARWSKAFGYIAIHDPITGQWHDLPTKDAPDWARREAHKRKELWRGGNKQAFDLARAQMEEIWEAEHPPEEEGIVEEHPIKEEGEDQ